MLRHDCYTYVCTMRFLRCIPLLNRGGKPINIHRCLLVYVILIVCIHMCRAIAEGVKGLQPRKRPTDVFPDTLLLSGESLNISVKNVNCTGSTL